MLLDLFTFVVVLSSVIFSFYLCAEHHPRVTTNHHSTGERRRGMLWCWKGYSLVLAQMEEGNTCNGI